MIENDLKQNYINKFKECEEISQKYKLPNEEFVSKIQEIKEFKVTTPIIGRFSTGKSSMINAFLEERLLKTDIMPETAIPTEIIYGDNLVEMYKNNELI